MTTKKVLRNRLRELLAIKSRHDGRTVSQREVAETTGIAKTTIDRYARNEVLHYSGDVVAAICVFLNVEVGEFLIIEDETEGQQKTLLAAS